MENIKTVNDLRGTVWKISADFNLETLSQTNHLNTSDINNTQSYIKLIRENWQGKRYELDIAPYKDTTAWDNLLIGLDWTGRNGVAVGEDFYHIGVILDSTLYFSPYLPKDYLVDGGSFLTWLKEYGTLIETVKTPLSNLFEELSSLFEDITNALREKQGTTEPIKHLDIPSKIRNLSVGGGGSTNEGITINGDVVTLIAGENITAGDFVEIVSEKYQVDDMWDIIYGTPSCVAIDDNTVFIAHRDSNSELYGTIVKLADDGTITFHSNTISSDYYTEPIATLIDTNKVLIVTGARGEFRMIHLVEINGTTATIIASKGNSDTAHNNWGRNIVTIAPNKAFFAYEYNNDMDMDYMVVSGLAGTVIEVNGNTISEYNTILDDTYEACNNEPYCITLENNKVFIAISYGSDRELYGRIYEIIDNTPEYFFSSQIQDWNACGIGYQIATKLNDNKLFIVYSSENEENVLFSEIIDIGKTIDHVTTQLTSESYSANRVYGCEVISSDDDKEIYEVLVTYEKSYSLQCMKVKINQNEIEKITPIELQITKQYDCNETSSVKLGDNIFLAHNAYDTNDSVSLVGATVYGNPVAILTKNTIDGIAKTSAQTGFDIDIYVMKGV